MTTQAQVQGLGEFADRGFTLKHPDGHVLLLIHEGEQIAVFSETRATQKGLQRECARHLAEKHCIPETK